MNTNDTIDCYYCSGTGLAARDPDIICNACKGTGRDPAKEAEFDTRQRIMGSLAPPAPVLVPPSEGVGANLGMATNAELMVELDTRKRMGHTHMDYRSWNYDGPVEADSYIPHAHGADLTIGELQAAVNDRAHEIDPTHKLKGVFFAVELGGETGEALNIAKKLERERLGIAGSRATTVELAHELADVVITVCNLAREAHIPLGDAIIDKFNITTNERGLKRLIPVL